MARPLARLLTTTATTMKTRTGLDPGRKMPFYKKLKAAAKLAEPIATTITTKPPETNTETTKKKKTKGKGKGKGKGRTETETETATATATEIKPPFVPRDVFEVSGQITKTYFIGHHRAALHHMAKALANIGLVIECRDSRVPLSSRNNVLDQELEGRDRVIVYTKSRLSLPQGVSPAAQEERLAAWQAKWDAMDGSRSTRTTDILFTDVEDPRSVAHLVDVLKARAAAHESILGLRAFVVGLPNAGKSALLNALRRVGLQNDTKVAKTGSQPGVTRKMSTPVRVVAATRPPALLAVDDDGSDSSDHPLPAEEEELDVGEGVFVVDTPGVFHVYVQDPEKMLKLALVGAVKDWIVPAEVAADYLLFRLNRLRPGLYAHLCPDPTNDVDVFLDAVARRTGKLTKGGEPSLIGAASWVVRQWRDGHLGRFALDDVSPAHLEATLAEIGDKQERKFTLNRTRRREGEARRLLYDARSKRAGARRAEIAAEREYEAEARDVRQAMLDGEAKLKEAEAEAEGRGSPGR